MIVCSCNVFSDHQVRSAITKTARRPRMSQVYACLGCSAQCGKCARTIKHIMDEALITSATASVWVNECHATA